MPIRCGKRLSATADAGRHKHRAKWCCARFAKMICIRTMSQLDTPPTWRRAWSNWPRLARFWSPSYTHKLTDGYFAFKDLGQTQIKGVEEPLHIYEVLGSGRYARACKSLPGVDSRGLSGGRANWNSCSEALEQAKAGHGQIVGVMGEPGLGKSRLFYEFKLTPTVAV